MNNIDVINLFTVKANHDKYRKYVCTDALSDTTYKILVDIDAYYESHDSFDKDDFVQWFNHIQHPELKKEKRDIYSKCFDYMHSDIDTNTVVELLAHYRKQYLNDMLIDLASDNEDVTKMTHEIDTYLADVNLLDEDSDGVVTATIQDILTELEDTQGLQWRLPCLQNGIGPMGLGKFGVVAGRPDSGKTSFLCNELSGMAGQLKDNECILWLNNENRGVRILSRLYCALLNATLDQIKLKPTLAQEKFERLGGNKIKVIDIHGKSVKDITQLIDKYKPSLIVIDMIDHVKGLEKRGNETVDARLERLYQWTLELSCTKAPVLVTSQLNGEAEGNPYPDMAKLKGSTTGKQGAATFILMLGRSNEPGYENSRYISTPKNKTGHEAIRTEVEFNWKTGRFTQC